MISFAVKFLGALIDDELYNTGNTLMIQREEGFYNTILMVEFQYLVCVEPAGVGLWGQFLTAQKLNIFNSSYN